jgi:hypothetical protein
MSVLICRREIEVPLAIVRRRDLGGFLKRLNDFRTKHGKTRVSDDRFVKAYVAFHPVAGSPSSVAGVFVVNHEHIAKALRDELKSYWPYYDEKASRETIDTDEWPDDFTKE